jgi:tetratricopeptide (TPR) repeat protein
MAFGGESAESYYDEGLTASMKGELAQAVQNFEKAIRLDNTFSAAYHQLGKCYARMGENAKAVELLHQVVRNRPQQTAARLDLGFTCLALGKIEDARNQFLQVQGLEPDNGRAQLGLAQASFHEGDWPKALSEAEAALRLGGSNFPVLYLLGRTAKLAGNLEMSYGTLNRADALLEKTLEVSGDKPESYFLRGEVAYVREKYPAALEHYKSAEKYAVENRSYSAYGENFTGSDVLAKQGLCLQRLGQDALARAMGERIGAQDPEHKLGKSLREA